MLSLSKYIGVIKKDLWRLVVFFALLLMLVIGSLSLYLNTSNKARAVTNTYYVSNANNNGYALGADTNSGTSKATPTLTIDKALTLSAVGDVIIVNPSGTPYSENSGGSNYLSIAKATTIETDPDLVGGSGKATITAPAAGSRVIHNTGTGALNLIDLIVDGGGFNRSVSIISSNSTGALTLTRVDFAGIYSGKYGLMIYPSASAAVVLDKCTALLANNNSANSGMLLINSTAGTSTVTLKGCRVTGLVSMVTNAANNASITLTKSTDETRGTITNCTGVKGDGTAKTAVSWNIQYQDFVYTDPAAGTYDGWLDGGNYSSTNNASIFSNNTVTVNSNSNSATIYGLWVASTFTSLTIQNNTFTSVAAGNFFEPISIAHPSVNSVEISNNTATGVGITTAAVVSARVAGTNLKIHDNNFTWDGNSEVIGVGGDSYYSYISNRAAATGGQNLADVSGNSYIDQPFTYPAVTATNGGVNYLGYVSLALKKAGNPTGNIAIKIYDDSAGHANNSLLAIPYTIQASVLTGSYQEVGFYTDARYQLAASTKYHIVVTYDGVVNGTDYIILGKNAAADALYTSTDGLSWSAGSGTLQFFTGVMALSIQSPEVYNNTINATNTSAEVHAIILNTVDGGLVYKNIITGGSIGILFKLSDGSVRTLKAYDNMLSMSNNGAGVILYDKGSKNAQFWHNTVVSTAGTNTLFSASMDYSVRITGAALYNGTPSRSVNAKNNIFSRLVGGYVVILGGTYKDLTIITPDINNNLYYTPTATNFALVNLGTTGSLTSEATFSDYKAFVNTDANSTYGNPALVNNSAPSVAADFKLTSASAAIDAGVDLNLNTDLAGKQRYDMPGVTNTGSAGSFTKNYVDIGAYEYVTPPTPTFTSSTHPSESGWYANNAPIITVNPSSSTTTYKYTFNQTLAPTLASVLGGTATASPTISIPAGTVTSEGTWYLHTVSYNLDSDNSTTYGTYAVNYDATSPLDFTPVATPGTLNDQSTTTLTFATTDATSGVASYALKIDDGSFTTVTSPYTLDVTNLSTGTHTLTLRAQDLAGNYRDASLTLTINRTIQNQITSFIRRLTSPSSSSTSATSTPALTNPLTSIIQKLEEFFKTKILELNGKKIMAEVKFKIVDPENNPIPNLEVTLHSDPKTATTDSQGIVTFSDVPVGDHTLTFSYQGEKFNKRITLADQNVQPGDYQAPIITVKAEKDPIPTWTWLTIAGLSLLVILLVILLLRIRNTNHNNFHSNF